MKDVDSLEAKISSMFVETSQATMHWRSSAKYHFFAQVVTSFLTKLAISTGYSRFDGHSVADLTC